MPDIPLSLALRAMRVLQQQGPMTRYDLAAALELSDRHALRVLQILRDRGWVRSEATTPTAGQSRTRYRIARATIRLID